MLFNRSADVKHSSRRWSHASNIALVRLAHEIHGTARAKVELAPTWGRWRNFAKHLFPRTTDLWEWQHWPPGRRRCGAWPTPRSPCTRVLTRRRSAASPSLCASPRVGTWGITRAAEARRNTLAERSLATPSREFPSGRGSASAPPQTLSDHAARPR